MLHAIACESEAVHEASRALFVARATGRSIKHAMEERQLSHSCNLLMSRIVTLRRAVTEFDRDIAGAETESLGELGLRAQTAAILLLLDELVDAMRDTSSSYQDLFTGRLRAIEDVVAFLFDSLARINRLWLCHRAKPYAWAATCTSQVVEAIRPHLYRSAIRHAQCAIVELGADPNLAHVLRVGSSRIDAPRIRRACDQLTRIFNVTLTRDPDPALFLAAAVLEPEELYDFTTDDGATS